MNGKPTAKERRLHRVLSRQITLDSISHLIAALKSEQSDMPLDRTALALDTSAFLRLARHRKSADVLDYIGVNHKAPFIIPGQAIQEFWNNQMSVVDTVAIGLGKKFASLKKEMDQIDVITSDHIDSIKESLTALADEHGHIYDTNTNKNTIDMLESFKASATVSYANRDLYRELAVHRKMTKTPPGFRDEGDGDFYIWLDALTGLMDQPRSRFDRFVFVTLDEKPDWSRGGIPHPILSAEIAALFGCPFEIWKPDKLADEVMKMIDQG